MKITLDSQSSIESIRNVLAGLYSGHFEAAMSVAEALLERVTTEVRRQPPPAICSSVQGNGCDRRMDCENCPAFDLDEAKLIKNKKLAAKLNQEMEEVEEYVRGELIDIDCLYRKIELDEYRKEQLPEIDSLPF